MIEACQVLPYSINPLGAEYLKCRYVFAFHIIPLHWDGAIYWNHCSWKMRIHSSSVINIMAGDDLAIEEAIIWANGYSFHSCPCTLPGLNKLEQLERLRSEDTPRRLMITHTFETYWIPSQKNNRSRTENVTEQTRFSKSRSNDLEDIGQGQRSSHATHLLMLVIICTKYGKNPSRIVDATERTRFSRSRLNDLEDIGQGQSSSYATHLLMC